VVLIPISHSSNVTFIQSANPLQLALWASSCTSKMTIAGPNNRDSNSASYAMAIGEYFPRLIRPEREGGQVPYSNCELNNMWILASTIRVEFVVNKVELGEVFLWLLLFSLNQLPLKRRRLFLFIYHPRSIVSITKTSNLISEKVSSCTTSCYRDNFT